MKVKDFRKVYGSGCYLNLGRESYSGWIVEGKRLIECDELLSQYNEYPIINIYTIDHVESGPTVAIIIP